MARKQKDDWVIDEWDDSLDSSTKPKEDSFGIPDSRPASDEWDDIPAEWQQPAKGGGSRPPRKNKTALIAAIGSAAAVLVVVLIIVFAGGGSGQPPAATTPPSFRIDVTTAPPAAGPADTDTPSPEPRTVTDTPTPEPTPTPTRQPTPEPTPTPTPSPSPEPAVNRSEWYEPEYRYYYHFLTEHEKEVFNAVYGAIMDHRSRASYSYATNDELDHVFTVLMHDCPELFFVDMNGFMYTHSGMDIRYRFMKAEYDTIREAIHAKLDTIAASFPAGADDFEKQLVIYRYLIDHCDYLVAGDDSTACADACLYYGKSQCSGYAAALSLALRHFGIQDMVATSSDHAWNIVKIGGKWYNCDATWDDTATTGIRIPYDPHEDEFNAWMNLPDSMYMRNKSHQPDQQGSYPLPKADSLDQSYAKRKASYIPPGQSNPAKLIDDILKEADRNGKKHVLIMLDDEKYLNNWNAISDKLYKQYNNYGWVFYPPDESHRCIYAVPNES